MEKEREGTEGQGGEVKEADVMGVIPYLDELGKLNNKYDTVILVQYNYYDMLQYSINRYSKGLYLLY